MDDGRSHHDIKDGPTSHENENHAFTGPIHDHHTMEVLHEMIAKNICVNSSTWVSASSEEDVEVHGKHSEKSFEVKSDDSRHDIHALDRVDCCVLVRSSPWTINLGPYVETMSKKDDSAPPLALHDDGPMVHANGKEIEATWADEGSTVASVLVGENITDPAH